MDMFQICPDNFQASKRARALFSYAGLELSIGNRQSIALFSTFFYRISIYLYFFTINFQPCSYAYDLYSSASIFDRLKEAKLCTIFIEINNSCLLYFRHMSKTNYTNTI